MIRSIVGVILTFWVLTGVAFSQGSTGRRHQDPNYLVTRTVSEAIVSIDVKASELAMRDFDGKSHTVKVNKETKFSDEQIKSLNDLRVGQRIRLTYRAVDSTVLELRTVESFPPKQNP